MLQGKTVLVTGGTGSFGYAVVKRLLTTDCSEVRVFSRDEKKQDDMRHEMPDLRLTFHLGDVRDYTSVHDALQGVDHVFHAAALKQVPACEVHPMEAIKTNVLGAENVMRAAIDNMVDRCVLLSTDKAVCPANAMGMSKALMEKIMVAKSHLQSNTVLCATRYGNVMGSRGSVIPLFVQQLLAGEALTVTDPAMTRFLMSAEESVDLVLYAFAHAQPGDIFVQKAPASTVGALAQALGDLLHGKGSHVVGIRQGEKLHESLISPEEMTRTEDLGKYYRIAANPLVHSPLGKGYTSDGTQHLDQLQLQTLLRTLPVVKGALAA